MSKENNVFISYVHSVIYDKIIISFKDKISAMLKDDGFSFFFDKDYLYLGDWEKTIDSHILNCGWMLFFVSKQSTSSDGYCLNELANQGLK